MRGIKCKNGIFFAACNTNYIDAYWKLEEAYYEAQGCSIEEIEEIQFYNCNCEHCGSLEHEFEKLIELIEEPYEIEPKQNLIDTKELLSIPRGKYIQWKI